MKWNSESLSCHTHTQAPRQLVCKNCYGVVMEEFLAEIKEEKEKAKPGIQSKMQKKNTKK